MEEKGKEQDTWRMRRRENLLAAETLVSDCGIVTFHITEIRVYDYLSLFSEEREQTWSVRLSYFRKTER